MLCKKQSSLFLVALLLAGIVEKFCSEAKLLNGFRGVTWTSRILCFLHCYQYKCCFITESASCPPNKFLWTSRDFLFFFIGRKSFLPFFFLFLQLFFNMRSHSLLSLAANGAGHVLLEAFIRTQISELISSSCSLFSFFELLRQILRLAKNHCLTEQHLNEAGWRQGLEARKDLRGGKEERGGKSSYT